MPRLRVLCTAALAATLAACGGAPAAPAKAPLDVVADAMPAIALAAPAADAKPLPEDHLAADAPAPGPVVRATLPAARSAAMSHVWQTLNNCGPAAVVMALSTLGVTSDQETARLALRGPDIRRGMGPAGVAPWVGELYGLRAVWRYGGTHALMKALVSNGFAPMVTQWLYDPSISRTAHWRTIAGYDDARGVFYVNDSMRGPGVPLDYAWSDHAWQPFGYRYLVVYRPEDEPLLRAIIADDWTDQLMRARFYERAREEAAARDDAASWLAYGEAALQNGHFSESVFAFERGLALGPFDGVFTFRSSYPRALREVGRSEDADAWQSRLGAPPVQAVR